MCYCGMYKVLQILRIFSNCQFEDYNVDNMTNVAFATMFCQVLMQIVDLHKAFYYECTLTSPLQPNLHWSKL